MDEQSPLESEASGNVTRAQLHDTSPALSNSSTVTADPRDHMHGGASGTHSRPAQALEWLIQMGHC